MSILITGGAGYIGSHLVHELAEAGEDIVVLDDLSAGFATAIPQDVPLIVGDCGDATLLSDVISAQRISSIIHLAASISVPESARCPLRYYSNNTANTRTLIEAAVKHGIRNFVFSSTAAVYGPPAKTRVSEESPTCPISTYGRSKLMCEMILQDAGTAHRLGFAILRFFNAAGAHPLLRTGQSTPGAENLIKHAIQAALGLRSVIEIYGANYPTPDGTCIRDYVHVMDLAQSMIEALHHLRRDGGSITLNVGYGHGTSVQEVIEAVQRSSGATMRVDKAPRRANEVAAIVAESQRLRDVFGWRPRYDDLDFMVSGALAWEKILMAQRGDRGMTASPQRTIRP